MMSYVKLAIRLRPGAERTANCKNSSPVVAIDSPQSVSIRNPKVQHLGACDSRTKIRRFTADYCFDSSLPEDDVNNASQEKVYECLSPEILKSLESGRSVCVVAYGQSGTGKTYTMMGSQENPGLIPRLCRDVCKTLGESIVVSYLEIYNERVHDLLTFDFGEDTTTSLPRSYGNFLKNLRVREHPNNGPYVQNLRRVTVHGEEALLNLVRSGTARRRTAATSGHHLSSRSHALLELRTSKGTLYLADLAGSEKANSEVTFRGRLKEGANINKSLVALSNVISALVSGGWRSRYIPYRDSVLTWLLKDSFSGGGSTFIIATISPDSASYGPSLSTLRWAARARRLPPPKLSFGSTTIRVSTLLKALANQHIQYIAETGSIICDPKYWKYIFGSEDTEEKIETSHKNMANQLKLEEKDKNASLDELNKEKISVLNNKRIDRLLGPALHRTSSDNELSSPSLNRNQDRKYRSHEILPLNYKCATNNKGNVKVEESKESLNSSSLKSENSRKTSIIYDVDRRAAIVASVTERLYSKMKKKKESAAAKLSNELNVKNAKSKLVEFGQRVRTRRRVTNSTQTTFPVLRVKDQSIDIQTDLDSFFVKKQDATVLFKNVTTETNLMTARCKEIGVGPKDGSVHNVNIATITDSQPLTTSKSFGIMTDQCFNSDNSTQTIIKPPPRKKKLLKDSQAAIVNISINCSNENSSMSEDSIEGSKCKNDSHIQNLQSDCIVERNPIDDDTSDIDDDFIPLPRCSATANSINAKKDFSDIILGRNHNTYPYNIVLSPVLQRKDSIRKVSFVSEAKDSTTSTVGTQTNFNTQQIMSDYMTSDSCEVQSLSGSETSSSFEPIEHNLKPSSFVINKRKIVPTKNDFSHKYVNKSQTWGNHMKYDVNNEIKQHAKTRFTKDHIPINKPLKLCNRKSNIFLENYLKNIKEEEPITQESSSEQDYAKDFDKKKKFFENYINEHCKCYDNSFNKDTGSFYTLERDLLRTCNEMENSIERNKRYFNNRQSRSYLFSDITKNDAFRPNFRNESPSEYLHKLVELRKKLIEDEKDTYFNSML